MGANWEGGYIKTYRYTLQTVHIKHLKFFPLGKDRASCIHWFTSQKDAMVRTGFLQSHEPGMSSTSPNWMTGAQALEPSSAVFQIH